MKYYVKKRRLEFKENQPEVYQLCHLENIHVEIKDVLGVLKEEGTQQSEG